MLPESWGQISPPHLSKIATYRHHFSCPKSPLFGGEIATFSLNLHIFWKISPLLFWKIWQLSEKNSKNSHQTTCIAFLYDNFHKNLEFCQNHVFSPKNPQNLWDLCFKNNRHSKKTDRHLTLKIATVAINRHFWKHCPHRAAPHFRTVRKKCGRMMPNFYKIWV